MSNRADELVNEILSRKKSMIEWHLASLLQKGLDIDAITLEHHPYKTKICVNGEVQYIVKTTFEGSSVNIQSALGEG